MRNKSKLKEYYQTRYKNSRDKIIEYLGGKCVKCGSKENLEIDHIDPSTKLYNVSSRCRCFSWDEILLEVKKCQLLCESCHNEKTILDLGNKPAIGTHGTLSSFRYCKCDLCRKANNEYMRDYKRKKNDYRGRIKPRTGLVHGTKNAYSYYGCRCEICCRKNTERHQEYRKRKASKILPLNPPPTTPIDIHKNPAII
jgi:hypothetical protein